MPDSLQQPFKSVKKKNIVPDSDEDDDDDYTKVKQAFKFYTTIEPLSSNMVRTESLNMYVPTTTTGVHQASSFNAAEIMQTVKSLPNTYS